MGIARLSQKAKEQDRINKDVKWGPLAVRAIHELCGRMKTKCRCGVMAASHVGVPWAHVKGLRW